LRKPTIVLIQPDSPFLAEPLSFPSLGLLYISSYLKKAGYNPEVYDLTGGLKLSSGLEADIFGFSCQIPHFPLVTRTMNRLKQNNPDSIFVIGGPHATWMPQKCLDEGFDIVVRGEGEFLMLKIVKEYESIRRKKDAGKEFRRIYVPEIDLDPDSIPFPDWEAIDIERYRYGLEGFRCMSIITTRGNCPFGTGGHCYFCSKTNIGRAIPSRYRSVENVLKEARILRDYGFGALAIYDDEVMINKKRDLAIFKGLQELGMKFRCMTRADLVTKEHIRKIKEYGCAEICFGAESGDPYILDVINKGTSVEQNTRFVDWCHEVGLRVKAYLMIGLPSENPQSVEKTKKWLKHTMPDNYDLSVFVPYPGSEIYEHKDLFEIDWDANDLERLLYSGSPQYDYSVVHTPYLSAEEITTLRNEILKEIPRGVGGTTEYWGPNAIWRSIDRS